MNYTYIHIHIYEEKSYVEHNHADKNISKSEMKYEIKEKGVVGLRCSRVVGMVERMKEWKKVEDPRHLYYSKSICYVLPDPRSESASCPCKLPASPLSEGLEYGWGVAYSEEYNIGFKQPQWVCEGSLPAVLWLDKDIVVFPSYAELGEDQQFSEFVNKIGNKREGIDVLDHVAVEILVVLVGA